MITFPSPSEFECLSFSSLCAAIKSRAFDPLTQLVYPEPWHPMRNRFNLIGIKGYLCRLPPSTALSRIARRRTPPFSHERKDKGNTTLLSKISTRDQERAYSMKDFFFFFRIGYVHRRGTNVDVIDRETRSFTTSRCLSPLSAGTINVIPTRQILSM